MAGVYMAKAGVVPIVAACMLLAGCISAASKDTPTGGAESQAPVAPGDVDPASPNGVVQGTVLSEETVPIAGAQVALQGTAFQTMSGDKGIFVFKDVPPAKYVLLVGALGYESAGRNVEVVAGQLQSVSIVLKAVEVQGIVYPETFHFASWFDCALGIPGWVSACSYPYTAVYIAAGERGVNLSSYGLPPDVQKNTNRFNLSIRNNVGQIVSEMAWTAASAAATKMQIVLQCGDYEPISDGCTWDHAATSSYITYGSVSGVSPLKLVLDRDVFFTKSKDKGKWDFAKRDSTWLMDYIGLPFQTQPQLAFQQKLEVYNTVFYNGKGPDGYTILGDS